MVGGASGRLYINSLLNLIDMFLPNNAYVWTEEW